MSCALSKFAFENDAGVEGRSLDGGEELILRGMHQIPAQCYAAQL